MSWSALAIRFPPVLEDQVLLALHEAGTLGIRMEGDGPGVFAVDGAPFRAPESAASGRDAHQPASRAIAYFERDAALGAVCKRIETLSEHVSVRLHDVADEAWVERQEKARRPFAIGRRFLIAPSPDLASAGEGQRIVLVIPPTRAFGTGEHSTTRLCLELIEDQPLEGLRVLDLGTGSGILAMAAAALGAGDVTGIDTDPEAIEIARENLSLNGWPDVPPSVPPDAPASRANARPEDERCLHEWGGRRERPIELIAGQVSRAMRRFDLIVSNIHAGPLEALAPALAALQGSGDRLILSGFSPAQADGVGGVYEAAGYAEVRRPESGEWAALLMEKHA